MLNKTVCQELFSDQGSRKSYRFQDYGFQAMSSKTLWIQIFA